MAIHNEYGSASEVHGASAVACAFRLLQFVPSATTIGARSEESGDIRQESGWAAELIGGVSLRVSNERPRQGWSG